MNTNLTLPYLTEVELEFLAEDEKIIIIPNFKSYDLKNSIKGFAEDYGPFLPNQPISVPLWFAIQLKKLSKCQIQPPAWMDPDELEKRFLEEKSPNKFTDIPYYYYEIFTLLLYHCPDDIPQLQRVKTAINDIHTVRYSKIKSGVKAIVNPELDSESFLFNGLSSMELCSLRTYLFPGLEQVAKHNKRQQINQDNNENN